MSEDLTKQELIHNKGFNIFRGDANHELDYGRIKVGPKELEDAIITFGSLEKTLGKGISKGEVLKALFERDLPKLREIS